MGSPTYECAPLILGLEGGRGLRAFLTGYLKIYQGGLPGRLINLLERAPLENISP